MPILSINGDNYPETFANMVVVNAPAMFDSMFTVVKRLLPPDTQKKIKVCVDLIVEEMQRSGGFPIVMDMREGEKRLLHQLGIETEEDIKNYGLSRFN